MSHFLEILQFTRNAWACATFNIAAIKSIRPGQCLAALLLQGLVISVVPHPLGWHLFVMFLLSYSFGMFFSVFRRKTSYINIPISLGLVFVGPTVAILAIAAQEVTLILLVGIYPVFFALIEDLVAVDADDAKQIAALKSRSTGLPAPQSPLEPYSKEVRAAKSMLNLSEQEMGELRAELPSEFGNIIGQFYGRPIWDWIRTNNNLYYDFECALPRSCKFTPPGSDWLLLTPGLLYRRRSCA